MVECLSRVEYTQNSAKPRLGLGRRTVISCGGSVCLEALLAVGCLFLFLFLFLRFESSEAGVV